MLKRLDLDLDEGMAIIICFASNKGGVGKTTSAIHFACALSQRGKTLLIDYDTANRSAQLWASHKLLPFTVCNSADVPLVMSSNSFDYIVTDTPACPSPVELQELARSCKLMLIPTSPDALCLSSTKDMVQQLPAETNYCVLITMVPPPNQRDGEDALIYLQSNNIRVLDCGIRQSKNYKHAALQGVPVYELKRGKDVWPDWEELMATETIQAAIAPSPIASVA